MVATGSTFPGPMEHEVILFASSSALGISDFLIPVGWTDGFPERVWRIFRVTNGLRRLSFLGSDFRMIGHAPD
ncbi:MAG: hypothetical protein ABIF71_01630, partial [Planctomycetota bacterium]